MTDIDLTPYGCALFDSGEPGTGWACDSEGNVSRIQSMAGLDNEHIWVSNLTFEQVCANGLNRHARIKGIDFLGRPLPEILRQYGLFNPLSTPLERELEGLPSGKVFAAQIAGIANRTGRIVQKAFKIDVDSATQSWSLPAMVGEVYSCKPHLVEPLSNALENASQAWARISQVVNKSDAVVRLYMSGRQHLKKIAREAFLPAPDASWERKTGAQAMKAIRAHPCSIARISIVGMSDAWSNILNFGTNTSKGRKLWVTSSDFVFLNDSILENNIDSKIEVIETWEPDNYFRLEEMFQKEGQDILFESDGGEFSLALSLACTALWTGLTQPKKPAMPLRMVGGKRSKPTGIYAPFIRAADRMILMGTVLVLREAGVRVIGYGKGGIDVINDGYSLNDWFKIGGLSSYGEIDCPVLQIEQRSGQRLEQSIDKNNEFDVVRAARLMAGSDVILMGDQRSSTKIINRLQV